MPFISRQRAKKRAKGYRIYFATDIHGSEVCFRKYLAAAKVYDVDALILGGDIAGKAIVPLRRVAGAQVTVAYGEETTTVAESDVDATLTRLKDAGLYPRYCDDDEFERLGAAVDYRERVFDEMISQQVREWCAVAEERLSDDVRLVITPGNDDPLVIDEILRTAPRVECPERELLDLGPLTLASLGNTTPTPWDTPREYSEATLATQIDAMMEDRREGGKLVFNFHCPPISSGLDTVAKLDEDLRPVVAGGQPIMVPAGSAAVLDAIKSYQPVVGLHGHIHESAGAWRCGPTMCLNPGSDYGSGVLKGAVVQFDRDGNYQAHMLTTG